MKTLEYISPTRYSIWKRDKEAFYMRYLAETRPPEEPQNQPMSIGSAFDAYCKNYLHKTLFGHDGKENKYALDTIFNAQVEEHNREWARPNGEYVFEQYRSSGALSDLLIELKHVPESARFEFEVKGAVSGFREPEVKTISNVTILGKPDVSFVNRDGHRILLDWKVNGYCSTRTTSPMRGYVRLRSAGRTEHGRHKDAMCQIYKGTKINYIHTLDELNADWAAQLAMYSWLLGNPVGGDDIVMIHQVCCSPNKSGGLPEIRIAEHALLIDSKFQYNLFRELHDMWTACHNGHIFTDLDIESSKRQCEMLEEMSKYKHSPDTNLIDEIGAPPARNYYKS